MTKQAKRAVLLWLILALSALVLFITEAISRPVSGVVAALLIVTCVLYLGNTLLQLLLRD